MDFNFGNARPRSIQQAIQTGLDVPFNRAVALSDDLGADRLVTAFAVTNYSNSTHSVMLCANKFGHNGIEIPAGTTPIFTALQEGRQLYEVQVLAFQFTNQQATDLIKIPIIVWSLTEWYLIAMPIPEPPVAPDDTVRVTITAFPIPYL